LKKLITAAAVMIGVLAIAAPASAHVTVSPNSATQGGYARVAFRVPNESSDTSTNKLEIYLPEDAPVPSVSTMPVPGWSTTVTKRTLTTPLEVHGSPVTEVVSVITWTATDGVGVKPGEFQEFPVSMGPLPKVDQMVFKALQTYSDGAIVRWIDPPATDGAEVEHPSPVLKLAAATDPAASPTTDATVPLAQNDSGSGLGWAALAVSILALIVAGFAVLRTKRS
jgi:uncharacterized protein YcnI